MRRHVAVAASVIGLALMPAGAGASNSQESVFEDESVLLQQGPDARNRALNEMSVLGVDTIRTLVLWRSVAPDPDARRRPAGFDGRDPAAYPAANWDALDSVVRGADARGIAVLLSPSTPIPVWASRCTSRPAAKRRVCKPDPKLFGQFVQALGTRYSGSYADENQGGGALPRVARWSISNEPNQPGWLEPQFERKGGRLIPVAAHLYRALAQSGIAALGRTGHPGAEVLLGETAPIGRTSGTLSRRPIPPAVFIRELFCLDGAGRSFRGAAAKARSCTRPRRMDVGGFAHHPYTRGGSVAPRSRAGSNEITIVSVSRLKRILAQGARAGRVPGALPIHYTEYGFQTNPPDKLFGVSLDDQAAYINESDWIAYQDSRIASVAQYKLIDEPNVANFQTGLRFLDGRTKPSYTAYRLPIWVKRSGETITVYGQIRPARGGEEEVLIQVAPSEDGPWDTVTRLGVASPKGHFTQTLNAVDGVWRLRWFPADGSASVTSRVAKASRR